MNGVLRICVGAAHVPGCHHEVYMQQGVERFLAHPRTRHVLTLCLANADQPVLDPHALAVTILTELARSIDTLDGCDPNVERLEPEDVDALDAWLKEAVR